MGRLDLAYMQVLVEGDVVDGDVSPGLAERKVVEDDWLEVACKLDVEFDKVSAEFRGAKEGLDRVFAYLEMRA